MGDEPRGLLQFRMLGPLEAWRGAMPLRLGGERQRALLALLLVHANELVRTEHLVDQLLGEGLSDSALNTARVAVSRLRRVLENGDAGRVLLTQPGGYLLRAGPEQLDAARFERLLSDGRGLLGAGDATSAAARLREALALWRGPPLADLALLEFVQPEIRRLEELRLLALMERIDADLALGADAELIGELDGLVASNPLQERLRGQLMLALYRAGRQADALAVYRELSGVLRDELGLEPSPSLQELERSILQQDPALGAVPRATARPPGNLPIPATPFLGRERELQELHELLARDDVRLLTLTGAGGSGKTRLALGVAEGLVAEYRDGAWFVGFADITDPELLIPTVCQALELAEQPGVTPERQLEEWLRQRELLLVLDNLEQLTHGTLVLAELLAGCHGLRMIATSREPLRLGGEQQYQVPVLEPGDAIELFTIRARAVAPHLNVDPQLADAICERLDRLPLAIELAAARTKVLSPAEILTRLERRLPTLASGPRDAPRRQQTLKATIDWSYQLLNDHEQRLFARLAVFAGGCTFPAAETVCDADLDALQALVDRSLLKTDGQRYWMLQTIRQYALQKLDQTGETVELHRRHAKWFVELLHRHGLDDHSHFMRRDVLPSGREHANFRAALEWAESAGELETVARLAAPLSQAIWTPEGQLVEAERWMRIAHEGWAHYPRSLQATVLTAARDLARTRGDEVEGAALGEQALAIYRELGDVVGIFREMVNRAGLPAAVGDLAGERAAVEEALRFAREHDLTYHLPVALVYLGDLEIAEGRLDQARMLCEEALSLASSEGTPGMVALGTLAHIANLEGRHVDAADLAVRSMAAAVAVGYAVCTVSAGMELAWSLTELGESERPARILGAWIEFSERAGVAKERTERVCEQAVRDTLQAQLHERAFQTLVDEGRNMTVEQAVRKELAATGMTGAQLIPRLTSFVASESVST